MTPNLARIVDMELVLQQQITGQEALASAEYALLTVSAGIRNYTNQLLHRVADDTLTLASPGGQLILLPELPVISIASVQEDGTEVLVGTGYRLADTGILVRQGRAWTRGWGVVTVTYTHGWDPIPDDITTVAARAAARLYQAGLRSLETGGVLGISSKSLGDFSVSYAAEGGGQEGMLGITGARVLTLDEKNTLNRYKL